MQLYLFQRWARKMYVAPGVLWVHTSSDELLILSACHWAGLVGDQPPQRGPPCHRGRQTSHLIYTFAGLEELGTIVVSMALWWYHVLTHLHLMTASLLGHTVFRGRKRHVIMWAMPLNDGQWSGTYSFYVQRGGYHKVEMVFFIKVRKVKFNFFQKTHPTL